MRADSAGGADSPHQRPCHPNPSGRGVVRKREVAPPTLPSARGGGGSLVGRRGMSRAAGGVGRGRRDP